MKKISYRPTKFIITENARKGLVNHKDNPYYPMAIDYMDKVVYAKPETPKTFIGKAKKLFATQSGLKIFLDKDLTGSFFIKAKRNIGSLDFEGNAVPLDMVKVIREPNYFNNIFLKAKESVLDNIGELNKTKRKWFLPRVR